MEIRLVEMAELDSVMDIYAKAREFMHKNGNTRQWVTHPERELVQEFIEKKQLWIAEENNEVIGVFAFVPGPDPMYQVITDGRWLDDDPYWVFHSVASTFKGHGFFHKICQWGFERTNNIRIDTFRENAPMLKAIEKEGFAYCGHVHPLDDPELELNAFQKHVK